MVMMIMKLCCSRLGLGRRRECWALLRWIISPYSPVPAISSQNHLFSPVPGISSRSHLFQPERHCWHRRWFRRSSELLFQQLPWTFKPSRGRWSRYGFLHLLSLLLLLLFFELLFQRNKPSLSRDRCSKCCRLLDCYCCCYRVIVIVVVFAIAVVVVFGIFEVVLFVIYLLLLLLWTSTPN